MRSLPHPTREQLELPAILDALSDPTRLKLFIEISQRDESPCGAFTHLASKTNVTYHVQRLREAGLVWVRIQGTSRLISLRREDVDARFPGLLDSILAAARDAVAMEEV